MTAAAAPPKPPTRIGRVGTTAFIAEPGGLNPLLHLGIAIIERATKQRFVPGRLLGWSPRQALPWLAGALVDVLPGPRPRRVLGDRMLNLVAATAAYTAASPYCIAANTEYQPSGLSATELEALRTGADVSQVASLTPRERLAVRYARLISATPLEFPDDFVAELTAAFTEREIVTLAATAAGINHNARFIEALGAPAPVFTQRPAAR